MTGSHPGAGGGRDGRDRPRRPARQREMRGNAVCSLQLPAKAFMNAKWHRWVVINGIRARGLLHSFAIILASATALSLHAPAAHADSFSKVYFDAETDQLVVVMRYRGTNPDHTFTLKWGKCVESQQGEPPTVSVEVLDDQWRDQAQRDFKKMTRFSLAELPCRPAKVTLRTAPRFIYTLVIPGRT
jgi:hypothetical protein